MESPPHIQQPASGTHTYYYIYGIAALSAFVLIRYLYYTLTSPLRDVPGPFLARFTRLWEIQAVRKHDNTTLNIELHEKYGPVVRLAPNRYSINHSDAAKVILGHHNAMDKSNYYLPFGQPDESNVFSEPSLAAHTRLRRPMAQLYSQTNLLSYEPFIDTCNTILLKRLGEYAENGKTLDVRELMQFYAFDVIGEITVGSRFGLMEDDGDKSGIIAALDEGMEYASIIGLIPEWHWRIGMLADKLGIKPSFRRILSFVNQHIDSRVLGQTKSRPDRSDFLDKMLPLEQQGKATRVHTRQAAMQNIAAGSDTTAISLSAVIAYLTMHPHTLTTLRHELDAATTAGTLSNPATFQEAQKLPYLQAVIMESLRMHPAVGAPMTRIVGPAGLTLAGRFFPSGTEVGVNAWVIHNNTALFGHDARVFRPERWLTSERAQLERNFLAFGAGPRTCLGRNISLMEMSKVLPQIVRAFDFELVPDAEGSGFSWTTRWFAKPRLRAVVRRRVVKAG
ncbi:hypothetical protein OPT61_g9684 [Boeremia exigua]|uniref:Uncharacterized protein n=1 Tax=Boeremia exigua TaxID=749465 RepID=A0ACC2HT17_9PLEO|nr:hypothetical protein OPT61_g9684 [Boeremia exigua]